MQEIYAQALMDDPSVFDYDGVYDKMQEQRSAAQETKQAAKQSRCVCWGEGGCALHARMLMRALGCSSWLGLCAHRGRGLSALLFAGGSMGSSKGMQAPHCSGLCTPL